MSLKLVLSLFTGLTGGFVLLGLPPVIDLLFDLYSVSYAGMSVLLSAVLWSHAAIQVPGGIVLDRLGVRRAMTLCLALMLAGSLLAAVKPVYGLALAGRILAGFGTGLSFVTSMKLIATNFKPERVGIIQGFYGGLFSGGSILAFYFLPGLVTYSWRWTYYVPAIMAAAALVMLFITKLNPESRGGIKPLPLKKIVSMKQAWAIAGLHAMSYGAVIHLGNWTPSVIAEKAGTGATAFAWVGMLVLFISAVSRFSGGFLLVRFDGRKLGLYTVGTVIVYYLLLFFAPSPWMIVLLASLICLFGSVNFGALWVLVAGLAQPESMGSVFGFVNLLANLSAVLFTLMMGWCKDISGSFTPGFLVMTVVGVICLTFAANALPKPGGKEDPA